MQSSHEAVVRVQKIDQRQRIVMGEVYAPNQLDTYGEFMLAADIETMAHRYMRLVLAETIDVGHDNVARLACPVESFIARKGDPDFTAGAWVLAVKIEDEPTWQGVLSGELNGFSFQAMVTPVEMEIEVEMVRDHVGRTEKSEQLPHDHLFYAQVDGMGQVIGGRTSKAADGHWHEIKGGTVTGPASDGSHNGHRFFL